MGFLDFLCPKRSIAESGILKGSTDRHSHILYGVDDGIKTPEDSLAVLAYEESLGVKEVWCTPHIMEDVPNTTENLKAKFEELCNLYKGQIKLHLAAEYMLDTVFEQRLKDRDLLTMEDDTLLVEVSVMAEPYDLVGMLKEIMSAGYHPLLAHPERYRYLTEKDYDRLHELGVKFQLNLASVTGYYGPAAQNKASYILDKRWYSAIGSDCHRLRSIKDQYTRKELKKKTIQQLSSI